MIRLIKRSPDKRDALAHAYGCEGVSSGDWVDHRLNLIVTVGNLRCTFELWNCEEAHNFWTECNPPVDTKSSTCVFI